MYLPRPVSFAAATIAVGVSLLSVNAVRAQEAATSPAPSAAAPGPDGAPPAGREDFRARMAERLKGQLKASDDEWTVIQPLLEKVGEKLRASTGFGGPGGPGGYGGGNRQQRRQGEGGGENQAADNGGNRPQRREGWQRGGTPEQQALRATLADDNSTVNDVKAKLQALRDQRKQATAELAQAREELRKVLNMRQEAVLVLDGILD